MNPVSKVLNNLGGKGTIPVVDHPSIPVLASLKANKTGLQLIVHLLAEWNNIEIRQISDKRSLLADLTLLWSQVLNPDEQLVQLWRRLIVKFGDELKLRWNQAMQLHIIYEKALKDTVEHLVPESIPSEDDINIAAEANAEAQHAANRKHHKRERSNMISPMGSNSGSINSITTKYPKMEKQDLLYRQKNARLNSLRRQFLKDATWSYPDLIEEQHDIAETVKNCVKRHSISRNKINCQLSRSNSNLTSVAEWISPFKLAARLQEKLERSLQLPRYHPLHYQDPRENAPRSRLLFGGELADEENPENSLVLVLLQAARLNPLAENSKKLKVACPDETTQMALYLEAYWSPNFTDNVHMVMSKRQGVRHSLILFYLSCLPTPLLPISNAEFTQFALKRMTAKEMVKAMPHRNRGQLRELCGYFSQMSKYDDKLLQQAGKHITRVKSDLMGDGSNGKTLEGLMCELIRFFKREKERTVLDISPISATWE